MEQHERTWQESPNIAKWRPKQGVNRQYTGNFDAIFFMEEIHICILAFYGPSAVLGIFMGIFNKGSGPQASLDGWRQLAWQATSYMYG